MLRSVSASYESVTATALHTNICASVCLPRRIGLCSEKMVADALTNNGTTGRKDSQGEDNAGDSGEELVALILTEGAKLPIDFKQPFLLPAWFDKEKFQRGQRFFNNNYFALFVAKLSGLLTILAVESILKVLILTGKSAEPLTAFRRYMDTIVNMVDWYEGDICNPNSVCRKSLLTIRARHCGATRSSSAAGFGPITQRDMAITQFGFMGFPVLCSEKLGIQATNEELEGFIHFWRVIGHLLGINDRLNLCRGDVDSTRTACRRILSDVLVPALETPVKDFPPMASALLNGMWAMVPFLQADAFMDFTRHLCGIPQPSQLRTLYSRMVLQIQLFVHSVLLARYYLALIFRPILNFQMWLAVFLTPKFPLLAFLTFGRNICTSETHYQLQPTMLTAS